MTRGGKSVGDRPSFWRMILDRCQGKPIMPSVFRPLEVTDPVEHNERIIRASIDAQPWGSPFRRYDGSRANELVYHPTVMCRWSNWQGGSGNHGPRPAIWRRDMTNPECASCLVEDPYE